MKDTPKSTKTPNGPVSPTHFGLRETRKMSKTKPPSPLKPATSSRQATTQARIPLRDDMNQSHGETKTQHEKKTAITMRFPTEPAHHPPFTDRKNNQTIENVCQL